MIALVALSMAVGQCVLIPPASNFTVVVDAGHGGRDSGASAVLPGRLEKDATLAISRLLASRLARNPNISVILTRATDRYLTLGQRRQIVASCRPDLVISIHADSGPHSASGSSVYVLNDAGEAIVVDRMTSKYLSGSDSDTAYILASLRQRDSINFAVKIAMGIRHELGNAAVGTRMLKSANFALLKSPGVPSLLVETGFVTNTEDATALFDARRQNIIADAIALPILAIARRLKSQRSADSLVTKMSQSERQ